MLIVKGFLTCLRMVEVTTIPINICVQQVQFTHFVPSCFKTEVKNKNLWNLNTNYNDPCIVDIFFEYDVECIGQQ